ncbi:glycoside hydrolase family 31 protein [Phanerochaete carnosa HHB-10118-sp]|uniref:Glycoside hydrolase family 31 protein n=1 Tax=Phanerochaete carnosa (strain HHB-10118-sp) TaxID=650164 RepID=K5VBJ8_PHACS|nr:glycoside hydrolase family 31 protein [Phanerochaete carnosa HHB-10118-sp]EKM60281.1 glycoside hydrolase family 31 protein [Phanerochaete carnosa HHB-10118-sp]
MLSAVLAGLLLPAVVLGREPSKLQRDALPHQFAPRAPTLSLNVSSCPGYTLSALQETDTGLAAQLNLAGAACDAFGQDIANLTLEVTYDSDTRLHVNIFDTANSQFTIPSSVIDLPGKPTSIHKNSSDLVFNYEPSPFAFWITRRSEPDAQPLFDTRISSLPPTPIPPVISTDNSTALDGFPLVFEDQYLQLTSALPLGTNIYGLGEVVASSGFRRDVGTDGGVGTIQTMWARDIADPIDQNVYGSHPIYLEHRYNATTKRSQTHGVFLFSSSGSDILLLTPPSSNVSLVEYRLIGGTLDLYFFSGPSPQEVIEQYGALVGLPTWQPAWGFGFHLCRWGYFSLNETREQVQRMRDADIPLEVMWNDINLYHAVRDFTADPVSFPPEEMRTFIRELAANNQHYIPIVDAAVAKQVNDTDIYDPYTRGAELDVWIKNPDGSEYVGQVWPGYTVFPDWFANNTQQYWTEALTNWSGLGIEFSGIWLDMNEASSFCDGSCGTGADLSNTTVPFFLPGMPGALVTDYPEGYNVAVWGPSGNMTINGTLTYDVNTTTGSALARRGVGAGNQTGVDLNTPPYAIHNGNGRLSLHALATNATHAGGYAELDVHNLWGTMEERATHLALQSLHPGKRPFIIARSTFPSAGTWAGHWLGDNFSKWQYMYLNIQGVLQFQVFQVPFVGADTCGFNGNTDEELCARWMQLSAFVPFYRNHNEQGALSQEPYRWDSVANASRTAMAVRYAMLPYWYTLFANASRYGTPPVRALWYEFPDEPELFAVDRQFLVGRDILITPVLTPNVSTVDGIFPGQGRTTWRDWYTHAAVDAAISANTTLAAPLGHIPVHVRDGSVLLLHATPGYTIAETQQSPYTLLVAQAADGYAFGTAYFDDGESIPPTPHRDAQFHVAKGQVSITSTGTYEVGQKLESVTVLGTDKPVNVTVNGEAVQSWQYLAVQQELVVSGLAVDLNAPATTISWQ